MIQSKYILDILDLILDEVEFEDKLRQQIPFLSEREKEHTGVGLYVHFNSDKEIAKYKIPTDSAQNIDIEGNPTEMITGVEIKNEKLNILADATVHLRNGLIDNVEIWNKTAANYPIEEPSTYEMTQAWLDPPKKRTIIRRPS